MPFVQRTIFPVNLSRSYGKTTLALQQQQQQQQQQQDRCNKFKGSGTATTLCSNSNIKNHKNSIEDQCSTPNINNNNEQNWLNGNNEDNIINAGCSTSVDVTDLITTSSTINGNKNYLNKNNTKIQNGDYLINGLTNDDNNEDDNEDHHNDNNIVQNSAVYNINNYNTININNNINKCNLINGREFENISNITLSNTLRQLASVVIVANDIFLNLNLELQNISDRTRNIKQKILNLEENVNKYNPKEVEVPESDFETFLEIKNHFKTKLICDKELFKKETRPKHVQILYEATGKLPATDSVDYTNTTTKFSSINDPDNPNITVSDLFEQKKIKINTEIEVRLPAAINLLRKWTSAEALGEITVTPDCSYKVGSFIEGDITKIPHSNIPSTYTRFLDLPGDNDLPIDHRLPSPEEQCQMIAEKYPAELITVDISGKRFDRMCLARKSMYGYEIKNHDHYKDEGDNKIKSKKSRGKRRNTIIGIDPKEITEALQGDITPINDLSPINSAIEKSKSSDLLRKESNECNKSTLSRFNSLKNWGRNRLKLTNENRIIDDKKKSNQNVFEEANQIEECKTITIKNKKKLLEKQKNISIQNVNTSHNNNEKVTVNYFKSGSTSSNSPESITTVPVKLRESSSLRRQRRNDSANHNKDEPHSSSGNWSASSECSEITILPKSSASSLNHNNSYQSFNGSNPPSSIISRRRFLNTSASSSVTSEGAPSTPDHTNEISFIDDETSSAYSCDTEGYYTSFHIDSGLKTLREEEPVTPLHSTSALSSNNSIGTILNQTSDSDYELFGRGSTSTTASSAGTVCTTLLTGNENDLSSITENKLSYSSSNCSSNTATLERSGTIKRNSKIIQKELIEVTVYLEKNEDKIKNQCDREKLNTPTPSESSKYEPDSDVESADRSERIRQKTAISSSRIPSMCIITPTTSDDDENSKAKYNAFGDKVQFNINLAKQNQDNNPYSSIGEYVTLQDVSNNNKENNNLCNYTVHSKTNKLIPPVYGNVHFNQDSEYVSLNELPSTLNKTNTFTFGNDENVNDKKINNISTLITKSTQNLPDMRVQFDAHGNVIFNSDTIKRRKGGHSTFLPGPHVKNKPSGTLSLYSQKININNDKSNLKLISGGCINRNLKVIRPIYGRIDKKKGNIIENAGNIIEKLGKDTTDSLVPKSESIERNYNKEFQKMLQNQNEPFKRNAQIYGTLPKKYSSALSPSKRNLLESTVTSKSNISSPADESFNKGNFKTSTPSKLNEVNATNQIDDGKINQLKQRPKKQDDEVPKVCSDRLGTSKTSLMDFKKLLLAKSTKNVTVSNSKLSAVELLKVSRAQQAQQAYQDNQVQQAHQAQQIPSQSSIPTNPKLNPSKPTSSLNSNMMLLELSRSPKSFANRRMIRQGQFGSPSKLIMSNVKKRNASYGLANSMITDVMSITIPESNKEDDSNSSSGSINSQKSINKDGIRNVQTNKSVSEEHIDLKNNFFLQSEENNFMKSEIDTAKHQFSTFIQAKHNLPTNFIQENTNKLPPISTISTEQKKSTKSLPSFETSL